MILKANWSRHFPPEVDPEHSSKYMNVNMILKAIRRRYFISEYDPENDKLDILTQNMILKKIDGYSFWISHTNTRSKSVIQPSISSCRYT
jgi:hypothetical protein